MEKTSHRHAIQPMDIEKTLEELKQRVAKGDIPTEAEIEVEKKETLSPYENPIKTIGKGYDDTTKKNDAKLKSKLKREIKKKDIPSSNRIVTLLEEGDDLFEK